MSVVPLPRGLAMGGEAPASDGGAASAATPAGAMSAGAAEDARLVAAARGGDQAAMEALYRRHVERVHRLCLSRLRDPADARDAVQDVFVHALRGLGSLRDDGRFGPWLMRIAHVTIVARWRRAGRGPVLVAMDGGRDGRQADAPARAEPRAPDDPERDAHERLASAAIAAALGRLTELQRDVVSLRFLAELSVADTADVLGCTEDAVKKLQRRGLAALRVWLDREDGR